MLIENPDLLRLWLTVNLRTLCDADPAALGKYVIALLRKDKPDEELRQGMLEQLDVFLQHETIPFVDRLMKAINTKEYLDMEVPEDGTLYALEKGQCNAPTPYHELPNPFEISTSSESSRERKGGSHELNTTSSSSSNHEMSVDISSSDVDPLNTSNESNRSDESVILAADSSFRRSPRTTRITTASSQKDKFDKDRAFRRKSRSPLRRNRSRSRERGQRSYSPKEEPRTGRYNRGGPKRSPARRVERDPYDRRRSPRNRSLSPYGRDRSPHRYSGGRRGGYDINRSRSPTQRDRSRSRSRSPIIRISRLDGMDSKGSPTPAPAPTSPIDQSSRVESAVVAKNDEDYLGPINGNRCKDYDVKGLCMRGEMCPFDHGKNPVVLQDVAGIKPESEPVAIPYREPDNPGYRLMRPHRPILPIDPPMHDPGMLGWGPLPAHFHPGMGPPRMRGGMMMRPPMFPMPPRELINVPVLGPPGSQMMEEEMNYPPPPMHNMGLPMYPQMRGVGHRMRGRGRGGFDHSNRLGCKPRTYTNCSLEVKRIPSAQNTISDLNSHFVQFGKIVNIQINFENDPEAALITFSSPNEAYAAYKSTEAVLNNRFVRVFWHNKEKENEEVAEMPRVSVKERLGLGIVENIEDGVGIGEEGIDRILVSGINVTKTVYNPNHQKREISQEKVQAVEAIKKSQEQLAAQEQLKRAQEEKKRETIKLMQDLQKKKQIMVDEQIEQQKKLIQKLENGKSMKPEEKDELMKLIKSLQESISAILRPVAVPSST